MSAYDPMVDFLQKIVPIPATDAIEAGLGDLPSTENPNRGTIVKERYHGGWAGGAVVKYRLATMFGEDSPIVGRTPGKPGVHSPKNVYIELHLNDEPGATPNEIVKARRQRREAEHQRLVAEGKIW